MRSLVLAASKLSPGPGPGRTEGAAILCLALCLAHADPDCEPPCLLNLGPASLLLDGGGPWACSAHLPEVWWHCCSLWLRYGSAAP